MGGQADNKKREHICVGLLAHVDAGKTTLAEGLLYTGGRIRRLGRVDHGNAFLDNFSMERERGITIFSKQAQVSWEGLEITLLDTPGHVDFSAEMERTLQVLDYALLVISGSDGVQGHVQTLWKLLGEYGIPVFLFVNKMDQPGADREKLLAELQAKLDGGCQEFGPEAEGQKENRLEELSLCDEALLEEYLESGSLTDASLAGAIAGRHLFPCYFGAALHLEGVEELLEGIRRFVRCPEYPPEFGARVYKISRDPSGVRLTHLKVTGGTLRVKMLLDNRRSAASGEEVWEEKADQLRIYGGASYETAEEVEAGGICAVAGLERTFAGQGLGRESRNSLPILAPVLTYGLILPEGSDSVRVLGQLRRLEEEEPQLHVVWQKAVRKEMTEVSSSAGASFGKKEQAGRKMPVPEIHVQVMGEVQIEILKRLIAERFGLEVEFTDGQIMYKETLAAPVTGIGHYEPLRHYAEVHLLLEPGEPGSGLQIAGGCSEDLLDRNWQRLIFTHLEERSHPGVLTGSPVTDIRITLLTGRAHLKHTEGGDFRQATYRAMRQGLMSGESLLLEPVFSFVLEVPSAQVGRAMSDIHRMSGRFDAPQTQGEFTVLTGSAPAAAMQGYQSEVNAYTRGAGRLSCALKGYEPCHDAEQVIERFGYDPEADLENPSSSVFCAHGAGFVVPWDQVPEYAHLENGWEPSREPEKEGCGLQDGDKSSGMSAGAGGRGKTSLERRSSSDYITQEEIEEIFARTYGKNVNDYTPYRYYQRKAGGTQEPEEEEVPAGTESGVFTERKGAQGTVKASGRQSQEEYLLVDGYNIIFAWEDLRDLAETNIHSARDKLMDICSNYQGSAGCTLILVFDAYKVKGNTGSVQKYHNIHVVYTKEAETADQYIEKTVHEIGRKHRVTVATSDRLEQMIIWGEGAARLSAEGFRESVEAAAAQIRERYLGSREKGWNRPFEGLERDME